MTPLEVTFALKEACKKFVSFKHKPMDTDITTMAEILTPICMEIKYDPVDRTHNIWVVIALKPHYIKKYGAKFVVPPRKKYTTTVLQRMQRPPKSANRKPITRQRGPIACSTTP